MMNLMDKLAASMRSESGFSLSPADVKYVCGRLGIGDHDEPHIRYGNHYDISQLVRLEKVTYPERPMEKSDFISLFDEGVNVLVGVAMGEIRTSCTYFVWPDAVEIVSVAVAPAWQRNGIGSMLLRRALQSMDDRRFAIYDMPDDNLEGHLFLKANGFRAVDWIRQDEHTVYRFAYGDTSDVPPLTMEYFGD